MSVAEILFRYPSHELTQLTLIGPLVQEHGAHGVTWSAFSGVGVSGLDPGGGEAYIGVGE